MPRALIVHEWLTNNAGSERVVAELRSLLPSSVVATTMTWGQPFDGWDVVASPLQRFASGPTSHVRALPLMPAAWSATRLPEADVTVTSFHTFALWARTDPLQPHWVYCHTPPRFLWSQDQMRRRGSRPLTAATGIVGPVLRPADRWRATARRRRWLVNSRHTAARVQAAYGIDADIAYPKIEESPYREAAARTERGDHYLVFGRLVPYKRVDLAIEAFRHLGLPLVVAGDGRLRASLEASAPANVRFIGAVAEHDKADVLAAAKALVFPGEEDFGIVPVEALAAGTPVVAYGRGGVAEIVARDEQGVLFDEQSVPALVSAIRELERRPSTGRSPVANHLAPTLHDYAAAMLRGAA